MFLIPFTPGDNNDTISTTIDGVGYYFIHHWNWRDEAHYFDMYDATLNPIIQGVKVALGANLARNCTDPFFQTYTMRAIDTAHTGVDADVDELGGRVVVVVTSNADTP